MAQDTFFTISRINSITYTDRGSRFFTYAYPAWTMDDIGHGIESLKQQYPDATHHCYAWRLDPKTSKEFAQDDGEPSGTAGLPILHTIKSESLFFTLIVVVRFFGGTKLGKPGLIQAYRESSDMVVEQAGKSPVIHGNNVVIDYPYDQENRVRNLKQTNNLITEKESFKERVEITVFCPDDHINSLIHTLDNLKHLHIHYHTMEPCYRVISGK